MKVPDGELKNCVLITSDLCRFKHAYCEINHICLMLRKKYTNRINNALRISSSLVYNNTITSYNTEVKKKKRRRKLVSISSEFVADSPGQGMWPSMEMLGPERRGSCPPTLTIIFLLLLTLYLDLHD